MVDIVAEISGNHGGDVFKARELIIEAAEAGCDYVKFQYYRPEDMPDRHEGNNEEMYRELMVHDDWLPLLFEIAMDCCVGLFASVFSARAAKEILQYDVEYIKLASPDSTKLSNQTYDAIVDVVPPDVGIIWSGRGGTADHRKRLYCPEGHPPDITWKHFSDFRTGNFWGFSDHTPVVHTPMAFVRAGAKMIEKHFKLEGDNACVDHLFSADPTTMQLLCRLAHNR